MGRECSPHLRMRGIFFLLALLLVAPLASAYWDGVNDMPPSGRNDVDSDGDGLSDAVDDNDGILDDHDDDDDGDGILDNDEDDDGDGIENDGNIRLQENRLFMSFVIWPKCYNITIFPEDD